MHSEEREWNTVDIIFLIHRKYPTLIRLRQGEQSGCVGFAPTKKRLTRLWDYGIHFRIHHAPATKYRVNTEISFEQNRNLKLNFWYTDVNIMSIIICTYLHQWNDFYYIKLLRPLRPVQRFVRGNVFLRLSLTNNHSP